MHLENEDVLVIGHEPEIAPFAYAITLFPPHDEKQIHDFIKNHCPKCPPQFVTILEHLNGAELDEISIYGIPPSMLGDPPLLNRQTRNPRNIVSASQHWWRGYPGAQEEDFLFGSRNAGWHQQLGYVLKPDSTVIAYPNKEGHYGERCWESIEVWLQEELPETLRLRDKFKKEVEIESQKYRQNIWHRIQKFLRNVITRD